MQSEHNWWLKVLLHDTRKYSSITEMGIKLSQLLEMITYKTVTQNWVTVMINDLYPRSLFQRGLHIYAMTGISGFPDSKVHGANTGPTWVLSVPDGPHVGPINLAIRETMLWSGSCYNMGNYLHDTQNRQHLTVGNVQCSAFITWSIFF